MPSPAKTISPFPTAGRITRRRTLLDPDLIAVEHDTPIPGGRQINGKYDELFRQMKPGSCIACEAKERETMRNALVKWLKRTGQFERLNVHSVSHCANGRARVWLIKR